MKTFVLSLLVIQATIHCASSKLIKESYLLSDKVCHDVDHLELVGIVGSEVPCGGQMIYKVQNSAAESPIFRYRKAVKDKLYVLCIVDADTPGCKTKLHYIIANLPGNELAEGVNSDKDVFSAYYPPEHGSPEHRYFVYAFSQTNPLSDRAIPAARCDFKFGHFVNDNSLKLVAVNMLKTQHK